MTTPLQALFVKKAPRHADFLQHIVHQAFRENRKKVATGAWRHLGTVYTGSTMKVTIKFDTDNAAFEDSFLMAVTKTLSQAKEVILDAKNTIHERRLLKDINGNRIGVVELDNLDAVRDWKNRPEGLDTV